MPPRAKRRAEASAGAGKLLFSTGMRPSRPSVVPRDASATMASASAPGQSSTGGEGPSSVGELAVNKRKVADVRAWLTEALRGNEKVAKFRKVLALTGPSGSGKSATVHALAAELGAEVVEWENAPSFYDAGERLSAGDRFADFLRRAVRYPQLSFSTRRDAPPRRAASKIVLVEDLPNVAHAPTCELFQTALQQYVDGAISHAPRVALVLCISDTVARTDAESSALSEGAAGGGGWRARRETTQDVRTVVPEAVRQHAAFAEIRFNPLTARMIHGALREMAVRTHGAPCSASALASIAEAANGDIRGAANLYSFLASSAAATGKRGASGARKADELVWLGGRREPSMALFHALGRVLFNKRAGDPMDDTNADDAGDDERASRVAQLLAPLWERHTHAPMPQRPWEPHVRKSRVDVHQLWDTLPVDAGVFQHYLHHNFPAFTDDVDHFAAVLEGLSSADALSAHGAGMAAGDLYAFHVATRSTLLALPSPVERRNQQLSKPAVYELARLARAHEEHVAIARARLSGCGPSASASDAALLRGIERRDAVAGSSLAEFATDVLPLVARIDPRYADALGTFAGARTLDDAAADDLDVALDSADAATGPQPVEVPDLEDDRDSTSSAAEEIDDF